MKALQKIIKGLDIAEETLLVVFLIAMVILNFVNVVSRKFLHASISATDEVSIMLFVWTSMIGAAAAYKRGAHLGMSFVVDKFNNKGQAIFVCLSTLCSLIFLVILVKYGIQMVQSQIALDARTPAIRMPAYFQGLSIPVGAAFMCLRTIEAGVKQALKLWNNEGGEEI